MKFNKSEIKGQIFLALLFVMLVFAKAFAEDTALRAPMGKDSTQENFPTIPDFSKIPHFPKEIKNLGNGQFPMFLDSRLRVAVDSYVNTKLAMTGDYFKAHVTDDFFLPTEPPSLLIPRGSWVRGQVSFLKKPNIFIMSGKIGLHLDELVTPLGDIVPLNAELNVERGVVNEEGFLNPPLSKGQQVLPENTQIVVKDIDVTILKDLLNGHLPALFLQGDSISLIPGQELQIVVKKEIETSVK